MKRILIIITLLLLPVFLYNCGPEILLVGDFIKEIPSPPPSPRLTLKVNVYSDTDGLPIEAARVTVINVSMIQGYTDSNGQIYWSNTEDIAPCIACCDEDGLSYGVKCNINGRLEFDVKVKADGYIDQQQVLTLTNESSPSPVMTFFLQPEPPI